MADLSNPEVEIWQKHAKFIFHTQLPINVKKLNSLKKVFKGDMAYITQLKQQKSKRCYYFGSTSPECQRAPK